MSEKDTTRNRQRLNELVPELTARYVDWLSLFAFPLSGGCKPWCDLVLVRYCPCQIRGHPPNDDPAVFGFRIFAALEKI